MIWLLAGFAGLVAAVLILAGVPVWIVIPVGLGIAIGWRR